MVMVVVVVVVVVGASCSSLRLPVCVGVRVGDGFPCTILSLPEGLRRARVDTVVPMVAMDEAVDTVVPMVAMDEGDSSLRIPALLGAQVQSQVSFVLVVVVVVAAIVVPHRHRVVVVMLAGMVLKSPGVDVLVVFISESPVELMSTYSVPVPM